MFKKVARIINLIFFVGIYIYHLISIFLEIDFKFSKKKIEIVNVTEKKLIQMVCYVLSENIILIFTIIILSFFIKLHGFPVFLH